MTTRTSFALGHAANVEPSALDHIAQCNRPLSRRASRLESNSFTWQYLATSSGSKSINAMPKCPVECRECGAAIDPTLDPPNEQAPCQTCGSSLRNFNASITESAVARDTVNAQKLIASLDSKQLAAEATALMAWETGAVTDAESVAKFMYRGGPLLPQAAIRRPGHHDLRPEKKYWDFVRDEMHAFLCTDDQRYHELWQRINALEKNARSTLIPVIAAFLGQFVGAPATLLAGFVTVCLYAAAKLGTAAYCKYTSKTTL